MKINTLRARITILFAVLLFVLVALFTIVQTIYTHGKRGEFFHEVRHLAGTLLAEAKNAKIANKQSLVRGDIEILFDDNSLGMVREFDFPRAGEQKDTKVPPPPPILRDDVNGIEIKPAELNGEKVLLLEQDGQRYIAIDRHDSKIKMIVWSLFLAVLVTISALYYFIIRSLKPINTLKETIESFGEGNLYTTTKIDSNDEIGQIARAFDSAAKQIRILVDSKDLFLKNAAHELRTPITKGIITTHLLAECRDKEILLNVFKRLETISESVINLEHFYSKDFMLELEVVTVDKLAQDAIELLFLDMEQVKIECGYTPILADSKLMTIVFKNLIDNGVKFADDGKVVIMTVGKSIIFKNLGLPLENPIEKYFDPFFKETSMRNSKGSGLGLFLSKKIANAHGLNLHYKYDGGYNCFVLG